MDKTEIVITKTEYYDGKLDAVYVELPNGQKTWLAVLKGTELTEPKSAVFLKAVAQSSLVNIWPPHSSITDAFRTDKNGDYFGFVCGVVKAIAAEGDSGKLLRVEVTCERMDMAMLIGVDEIPQGAVLEVGCYIAADVMFCADHEAEFE